MKTKNCGSCINFFKLRNDKFGGGLCEALDARTKSDHGHNCKDWSAKKYIRPKKIKIQDLTLN
jgi:hypothetical protein